MDSQRESTKQKFVCSRKVLKQVVKNVKLPRCMHCMLCGLVTRNLSVCLSNASFVTKRNKVVPAFLYHVKERLS